MSLRQSLFQSIAALDRIAPAEQEDTLIFPDEKIAIDGPSEGVAPHARLDDDKFIRLGAATLSVPPYLRRTQSSPSLRRSFGLPEVDRSKMEFHGQPEITWRYAARVVRQILTIVFMFLSIAIAITIVGLAADMINWGSGRGSDEANTVTAVVLGRVDPTADHYNQWLTKINYL